MTKFRELAVVYPFSREGWPAHTATQREYPHEFRLEGHPLSIVLRAAA